MLADVKLKRHYFGGKIPVTVELHGYSDASEDAYAAVIFVRATYASGPPSSELVVSKTKVAPPKTRTIPHLELCGAQLLAKLLESTRHSLKVPVEQVFANCDSTVVLAWLGCSPHKYKLYVANRI